MATQRATSHRGARRVPLHLKNEERREPLLAPYLRVASVGKTREDGDGVLARVEDGEQRVGEAEQEQAADLSAMN